MAAEHPEPLIGARVDARNDAQNADGAAGHARERCVAQADAAVDADEGEDEGEVAAAMSGDLSRSRLGPARRVLFFGKNMSRTRCSGALVESLREHGVEVRWRNLTTWRRWFGAAAANRLARAEFRRYRPDVVFVFFRDLPPLLAAEFRRDARLVIWCEEALEALDGSVVDYFALADLVCMSNPARFAWLQERGLDNMAFLMSGFSPRFHRPAPPQPIRRDVAFIGGPGRRGQRAAWRSSAARVGAASARRFWRKSAGGIAPTCSAGTGIVGGTCTADCACTARSTTRATRRCAPRRASFSASTRSTKTSTTSATAPF
jgi:hypothetical protein